MKSPPMADPVQRLDAQCNRSSRSPQSHKRREDLAQPRSSFTRKIKATSPLVSPLTTCLTCSGAGTWRRERARASSSLLRAVERASIAPRAPSRAAEGDRIVSWAGTSAAEGSDAVLSAPPREEAAGRWRLRMESPRGSDDDGWGGRGLWLDEALSGPLGAYSSSIATTAVY